MGRTALTTEEISDYRQRILQIATSLFARKGYAGVSMRSVATELGVTAMALYRYVDDKEHLLALVRADAFRQLAETLDAVAKSKGDPLAKVERMGGALVQFALENPDAYRIMFELNQNTEVSCPELQDYGLKAWLPFVEVVSDAVDAGYLVGDPGVVAEVLFAALHGLLSMHLAGKMLRGHSFEELLQPTLKMMLRGAAASPDNFDKKI